MERLVSAQRGDYREENMPLFHELVEQTLAIARAKHPRPIVSPAEAYRIIRNELEEFRVRTTPEEQLSELLGIACVCQRAIEDLRLDTVTPAHSREQRSATTPRTS